jgi:GTP pyrophosphokinase
MITLAENNGLLSERFQDAFDFAFHLHASQKRKESGIPYISHLMAVVALVLEDGGDDDQAIAALLHDAVEDQGGIKTLEDIRLRYGANVATIVEGCTDSYTTPKPPWRERKETYLEHLREASKDVRRVSLADKLHNARSLLADLRREGDPIWQRFNGGKDGTLWYYGALVNIFQQIDDSPMVDELFRVVSEIQRISRFSQ